MTNENEPLEGDLSASEVKNEQEPIKDIVVPTNERKSLSKGKKLTAGIILAVLVAGTSYTIGAAYQENNRVAQLKASLDETIGLMQGEVDGLKESEETNTTDESKNFEEKYFSKLIKPELEKTEKENFYENEPQGNYLKSILGGLTGSKKEIDEKLDKIDFQSQVIMDLSLKAYAYDASKEICLTVKDQKTPEIVKEIKDGKFDSLIVDFEKPVNVLTILESCNVASPEITKEVNDRVVKVQALAPKE